MGLEAFLQVIRDAGINTFVFAEEKVSEPHTFSIVQKGKLSVSGSEKRKAVVIWPRHASDR